MIDILAEPYFFPVSALILGLCLGSFYNVCVHRYLSGQSVLWPASHCPACGHVLSWWENIPLLSYVLLRGRCRSCRQHISWRYPLLELLSGVLAMLFALTYGLTLQWVVYMVFLGIFLVASFIDLHSFTLPDILTYPAALLALSTPLFFPVDWLETVFGALAGAGSFLLLQQAYLRLRKLEALGMGDVKLMLSLGALVGVSGLPVMVLLSSLSALLAFLPALFQSGKGLHMKIPFGPFLCLGAILTLLFGESMLFSIFWT